MEGVGARAGEDGEGWEQRDWRNGGGMEREVCGEDSLPWGLLQKEDKEGHNPLDENRKQESSPDALVDLSQHVVIGCVVKVGGEDIVQALAVNQLGTEPREGCEEEVLGGARVQVLQGLAGKPGLTELMGCLRVDHQYEIALSHCVHDPSQHAQLLDFMGVPGGKHHLQDSWSCTKDKDCLL